MSTNTALDRVQVHIRESAQLGRLFEGLTEEDWSKPSACDLWSISDVAAHLASGHVGRAENIGRGIRGEPPTPPPGYNMAPGGPAREKAIADRAISIKEEQSGRLVSYFKESSQQLNDVLAGIVPEVLDNQCWHGRGIRSVRAYVNLSIAEQAMHARDIGSGLAADAHLNPASLPAFLDEAPRWWGIVFKAGIKLPSDIRYRFRLSGSLAPAMDVIIGGDTCRVEEAGPGQADVQFDCDEETYVLMAYGRIKRTRAIAQGLLTERESGESNKAALFDSWF